MREEEEDRARLQALEREEQVRGVAVSYERGTPVNQREEQVIIPSATRADGSKGLTGQCRVFFNRPGVHDRVSVSVRLVRGDEFTNAWHTGVSCMVLFEHLSSLPACYGCQFSERLALSVTARESSVLTTYWSELTLSS